MRRRILEKEQRWIILEHRGAEFFLDSLRKTIRGEISYMVEVKIDDTDPNVNESHMVGKGNPRWAKLLVSRIGTDVHFANGEINFNSANFRFEGYLKDGRKKPISVNTGWICENGESFMEHNEVTT